MTRDPYKVQDVLHSFFLTKSWKFRVFFTLTAHLISDLATLPMLSGTRRGRDLGSPACTGSPSAERSTQDAEQVHFPTNEGK